MSRRAYVLYVTDKPLFKSYFCHMLLNTQRFYITRLRYSACKSQIPTDDQCSYLIILGDPGAASRDDAIFWGESLLQELKSPWELILTEPVPEVVEFRPADCAEKYFSAQSAMRSSWVTLSPSYTKQFSALIDQVAWLVQREDCRGGFQKKY